MLSEIAFWILVLVPILIVYPVKTKEIISRKGEVHFKRWCWFYTPWFAIYTHYIARSDEDKHPHNHPWSFISIVLWDSYIEEIHKADERTGIWLTRSRRGMGSVSYRNKDWYHKLQVESPTYTLVFVGPRYESWGHLKDGVFVEREEYKRWKDELRNQDN